MRILGIKPGHDGAFALIHDGVLTFSLEAEKNSFQRFSPITPTSLLDAAALCDEIPDCIALSGWSKGPGRPDFDIGTGYFGVGPQHERLRETTFFGRRVTLFEGTHESSHVWCSYGMWPFAGRLPCHVLVWEGRIGRFYRLNKDGSITAYPNVIDEPGEKYAFVFMLADPTYLDGVTPYRANDAGKLMALAAHAPDRGATAEETRLINWVLDHRTITSGAKAALSGSRYFNVGLMSEAFHALARAHSNAIVDRFMGWARDNLEPGLPLVIGGGCGLNCDWNSAWARSGLFSGVFVPPCANDSGSAIGTAIQAQQRLAGRAAITWNVYCGSRPRDRSAGLAASGVSFGPLDNKEIVDDLCAGHVVAVMRGPCEIGPRALGARSLLADPRDASMLKRLNRIKRRESYRPIAPVCTAEAVDSFFDIPVRDKYMLYFARVRDGRIPAVTHVDNSARVQTVDETDNPFLWSLLRAFGARTGVPVLCNTSLNLDGRGFIDEVPDLVSYCRDNGIERAVCDDWYLRI